MEAKKQSVMEAGCGGVGKAITFSESKGASVITGHNWAGWPGAYCLRCFSDQVLEVALAEGWVTPVETGDPIWKSEDYKALVDLCDGFCYSDMTPEQAKEHRIKIRKLCDKVKFV